MLEKGLFIKSNELTSIKSKNAFPGGCLDGAVLTLSGTYESKILIKCLELGGLT